MRYHPEDKHKTRQRIIKVAARRFRGEGLANVGIANLMADLGMTHGGFYAHFTDKEALVTAACTEAFGEILRHWNGLVKTSNPDDARSTLVSDYLSRHHREHPETGCFAAAVVSEIARRDHRSRRAFTSGIEHQLKLLESLGACRALGRESAKVDATDQNSSDSQANSGSIGQEDGGLWAEPPLLQPRTPKSGRLLAQNHQPAMSPEATLSLMVGAMLLARAVSDPELSMRLLDSASAAILGKP